MKAEESGHRRLFDAADQIRVKLNDGRAITVCFPSDEQLTRRRASIIVKRRQITGGKHETWTESAKGMDKRIVGEIAESPEEIATLDDAEATQVLDLVTATEVVNAEREGNAYRVFLQVTGGVIETEHLLGIPKQGDVISHRRSSARIIQAPYNVQEYILNYGHAHDLYQSLIQETAGYADGSRIPISHKYEAVEAAYEALRRDLTYDSADVNF
jgi:hypothetical protein